MSYPSKMFVTYHEEAPYERFDQLGEQALSDAELLAILLRSGTGSTDVLTLAQELLRQNGNSLSSIARMSVSELQRLPGIGPVKARQIRCVFELSKRISAGSRRSLVHLGNPSSIASYCMEQMRHEKKESLYALFFDIQHNLIHQQCVSTGVINGTLFSCRDILSMAMECNAASFVVLHNHPSGDPHPSAEDQNVTLQLMEAADLMGIPLQDHIIIGDNRYYSFRESGVLHKEV